MGRAEKRACLHCGEEFIAEARNARHQKYCGHAPCKAASKRASQAKWQAKAENQDYHRGPEAVARVKAWRADHPGYSRCKVAKVAPAVTVQEATPATIPPTEQEDWATAAPVAPQISCNAPPPPLQDLLNAQPIVLVGLIAHIWGSALQEDIASALSRLLQLGLDIRGGHHEHHQAGLEPGTPAPSA
jgi:hypothetical protein